MSNYKLLTVCSDKTRAQILVNSLDKFGWSYDIIETEWIGFGTKLLSCRDYLNQHPEVDGFFFCDAYDVIVLGTMDEALFKLDTSVITFSTEKACWPDSSLSLYYSTFPNLPWAYLNSGLYFAPRDKFLSLFTYNTPGHADDDQLWATKQFLFNPESSITLDTGCKVFQSYSFIANDEFGYENNRLQNLKTGTEPVLVHGNGTQDMSKVIELL